MVAPTKIQHPLLRRSGTSQRMRVYDANLLRSEIAPIDGRTLGDMLDFIHEYARLVVFHEYKTETKGTGSHELSNWLSFFKQSLPFTLNHYANTDFDQLESDLQSIFQENKQKPTEATLRLLLDFCFFELIQPLAFLQQTASKFEFKPLVTLLDRTLRSSLLAPLRRFIELSNASVKYIGTTKHDFMGFVHPPWDIPIEDLFATDENVLDVPGGKAGAISWLAFNVSNTAQHFLVVQQNIAREIPGFLKASIDHLGKRNEAHLGLLYTFIRLYHHFQGELNQLTQKHLDFFYSEVLQLKRRQLQPDQAHIIFERAKHIKTHLVQKDVLFKDGKDSKSVDILFALDEPIVIDNAKVTALTSMFLKPSQGCINNGNDLNSFVEGVYIAPVANSADGKGEAFREEHSKTWSTLGAKTSQYTGPNQSAAVDHPHGRLGFVLASPVLWLNEGRRDIKISMECDASANSDWFNTCFEQILGEFEEKKIYKLNNQTIDNIESLFSESARAFLQREFSEASPLRFESESSWKLFLESTADVDDKSEDVFGDDEKENLNNLVDNDNGMYVLRAFSISSIVRQLRLKKEQEFVGSALFHFSRTSGNPLDTFLSADRMYELIKHFFDESNKFVLDISESISVYFGGEEDWFELDNRFGHLSAFLVSETKKLDKRSDTTFTFCVDAKLAEEYPAVLPFGEKFVGEKFATDFPMVRIEFTRESLPLIGGAANHAVNNTKDLCCLKAQTKPNDLAAGLYHFFRFVRICKTDIDVGVSGLKSLVVQNEESLQDVDSIILPFGARPKLRSDFYVGSKELFCKYWNEFSLHVEWKEKPNDLAVHYKDYSEAIDLEIEPPVEEQIENESFLMDRTILDAGQWQSYGREPLFPDPQPLFPHLQQSSYVYSFSRKQEHGFSVKAFDTTPLLPLSVKSRNAFLRLRLRGASFQHAVYPFALARFLMQLAGKVDLLSIEAIQTELEDAETEHQNVKEKVDEAILKIKELKSDIETAFQELKDLLVSVSDRREKLNTNDVPAFVGLIDEIIDFLDTAIALLTINSPPDPPPLPSQEKIDDAKTAINDANNKMVELETTIKDYVSEFDVELTSWINKIELAILKTDPAKAEEVCSLLEELNGDDGALVSLLSKIQAAKGLLEIDGDLPKEPYTPKISSIQIDYTASSNDAEFIHLHPFVNTSKKEDLSSKPTLLPTFTDEGTLFIGFEGLRPLANLNLLLQFAEATADSESGLADIKWHYLTDQNDWKPLRPGFELLADNTERMTRSGIVKIALPEDISNEGNTLLPPSEKAKHLYWLKVSAVSKVASVAELVGVHAQAALATYTPIKGSDSDRVVNSLEPGQISKSLKPDSGIKKIEQPYESFGGRVAEAKGTIPRRMNELLRHKGRSVDAFDIEHLVLEAFPELYTCKCISHTMGLSAKEYHRDLEVAPGFFIVAVVPDLSKLDSGNGLEPMAPSSTLTKVKKFLKARVSPFARIQVKNPRYEIVHVNVTLRFRSGFDVNYYSSQIKKELSEFLAPWQLGDSDALSFGQHLVYSDVLGFIEGLEYIDYVSDLRMFDFRSPPTGVDDKNIGLEEVVPLTARSILTCSPKSIQLSIDQTDCDEKPVQAQAINLDAFLRHVAPVTHEQ